LKKTPKISKTFIVFLCASLFIWALIKLSKQYTSYVTFPIEYTDLSQNRLLQKAPQESINVLLKGTGFRLLSSNFSKKKLKFSTLKLEYKSNHDYYFITSKLENLIQDQLGKNLEVKGFSQDSIFLSLGELKSKKVIVTPKIKTNFQLGYNLSEKLKVTPDSVLISGPEDEIEKITQVNTEEISLENIHEDVSVTLSLQSLNSYENIRISNSEVSVFGKVDKYTEGNISAPFVVKNIPFGVQLNTFPKEVKITFKVKLSDFNSVTAKSFIVECDYSLIEKNNLNYLTPTIKSKPAFVSSVKLSPSKIEFLIQK